MGIHNDDRFTTEAARVHARQQQYVNEDTEKFAQLFQHSFTDEELEHLGKKNCQNMIGSVEVPVGIAGPVPVRLMHEEATTEVEYTLPLATTEGALIASIHRGCKAIRKAGGSRAIVQQRGMTRAPIFRCRDGVSALAFLRWVERQQDVFTQTAQEVSTHLTFIGLDGWVQGNLIFLRCRYAPDQAMGMNMVSIALDRAWQVLKEDVVQQLPESEVEMVALSGNLCTDKKTAAINRLLGRGWWVQAEVFLSDLVIEEVLKTSAVHIERVHRGKNLIGSQLAGDAAQNMHIANAAAALLIATGQDPAHTVDVSQGATSVELQEGGLYIAVTLPTVPIGVVGGGTWLPAQNAARRLLLYSRSEGALTSNDGAAERSAMPTAAQLAGAVGVAALAGEISGLAALASHHLARAHEQLGRGQR